MNEIENKVALQLGYPVHSLHGNGNIHGILSLGSQAVQDLFRFCAGFGGSPDFPGSCFLSKGRVCSEEKKMNLNNFQFGSIIDMISKETRTMQAIARSKPFTYWDDGRGRKPNNWIHAALPIRYCAYRKPAISNTRKATLSGYFMRVSLLAFSLHSVNNSLHGKRRQIASSESGLRPRSGDLRLWPLRLFSSLLLGRKRIYFSILALKYAKVGNILMEVGITW